MGANFIIRFLFFPILGLLFACSGPEEENPAELIRSYGLAGDYRAQITPSFMGTSPVTTGEHTIKITDSGDGRIRLFFDGFQEAPMPFMMTVDISMDVRKGSGNSLVLTGKKGIFRADPPDGEAIDPDDMPPGIGLPEGGENGLYSSQATIEGVYAEIEKDGRSAYRFDLDLTPGVSLPIQILIYTQEKIR